MTPALAKWHKYRAVGIITVKQQLHYRVDFVVRALFLLLILFIFIHLWKAAYASSGADTIEGFALNQIIWYLVFAEAVTMACPQLCIRIEEEVKQGEVAVRLIRPIAYNGFHYMTYLAEAGVRFVVQLAAGSAIAWAYMGPPAFGLGWAGLAALLPGAFTVAFLLNLAVALLAFWVEETRGMEFVLQKLNFTVGGMLLPLELMPDWLERVCGWLPFQAVLYFPARTGVAFDGGRLAAFLLMQWGWAAALAVLGAFIYRRGVRKLNVNGG